MAKLANVTEAISFLEEQLKSIKEKILEVEEDMEQLIAVSTSLYTNYSLLRSIKGIGIINAIVLLYVTDNFQRFDNPRKFACYCEVAPFEHTSGISIRGKTRTSSLANKEVKVYALFFCYDCFHVRIKFKPFPVTGTGKQETAV